MAETRKFLMPNQPPDISQMVLEAKKRWLRPTEICEILSNYRSFSLSAEPPNRPGSGSLFLFDRKTLRYFRKDGHNWRKKKDGKTVKEAHEKLKAGSIDVLHCYYAHGEENENFQRRTYWLLEEDFTHIVLVHYLEVKYDFRPLHQLRMHTTIFVDTRIDPWWVESCTYKSTTPMMLPLLYHGKLKKWLVGLLGTLLLHVQCTETLLAIYDINFSFPSVSCYSLILLCICPFL